MNLRCALPPVVTALLLLVQAPAPAQVRTAPDIRNPDAARGTGVNRHGIKTDSSPHRSSTHVVLPGGGYHYGYYPGGFYPGGYYYSDYFYYDDYYLCPYCGNRWCDGRCRYRGPVYLPPVVGDAGTLYGPRAAQQFLGVDDDLRQDDRFPIGRPAARAVPPDPAPPLSNPTTRARAWKFVDYGDRHFKQGDYRSALARYKKAESQASEIGDIYFRQAFTYLGLGQYREAVAAVRQGLARKPEWPSSGFVLEELFPEERAKRAIFRQLHVHLDQQPHDANALFLLSMLQHFDGQSEAAEVGMRRVVELTGAGDHARAFQPAAPEAQDAEALGEAGGGPLLNPAQ